MHGKLFVEPGTSNVRLVGFLNRYVLLLLGIAIIISISRLEYFAVIAISIMTMLYYFLEKHMYGRLINYLSEEKS